MELSKTQFFPESIVKCEMVTWHYKCFFQCDSKDVSYLPICDGEDELFLWYG